MRIPLRTTEGTNKLQRCGDCTACCHVLAIDELDKSNWKNCSHQCNKGCDIYQTKPQECSDYWCFFSGGMFGSNIQFRPDKLGLIFDFRGAEASLKDRLPIQFLQAWETRVNASKEIRAKQLLEQLVERFPIVIRPYGKPLSKMSLLGSRKQIKKITDFFLTEAKKAAKV